MVQVASDTAGRQRRRESPGQIGGRKTACGQGDDVRLGDLFVNLKGNLKKPGTHANLNCHCGERMSDSCTIIFNKKTFTFFSYVIHEIQYIYI